MDIDLSVNDIDRSYEIGKPTPRKKRPIIVKFVRYNDRRKVVSNNKNLKDSRLSITDSLSARRMEELSKARNEHLFKNVWTIDGKIFFKQKWKQQSKIILELNGINVMLSYGEKRALCVLRFFTQEGVRGLFGIIWDRL